jgi:hypothetical protein
MNLVIIKRCIFASGLLHTSRVGKWSGVEGHGSVAASDWIVAWRCGYSEVDVDSAFANGTGKPGGTGADIVGLSGRPVVFFAVSRALGLHQTALFERVGKRVALTDAGEGLLVYAKIILQALHDADQALMALKGLTGGKVTIGLVSTAKYIVPHMLTRR